MADRSKGEGSRPLLLLVEDDADLADLRAQALEDKGLEVSVSHSLKDALKALDRGRAIDCILTDINLTGQPGDKGGVELAKVVRTQLRDIPIIAYSSFYSAAELGDNAKVFDETQAKGSGTIDDLDEALERIASIAHAARQRREA
jgi:CheY-like chemotaxis protein